jgi:TetR/AcrR family transcriptional regulator, mexJK operon transcriptional repressor
MATREDPRAVKSRVLALEAAQRVFVEHGYHATSLARVAEEAGLAKRTLYNLFDDKETLFRATVLSAIGIADRFAETLAIEVRQITDPANELPAIGVRLATATLLGPAISLRRLLIMESGRFPDLVDEYRSRAPEKVMQALAELFSSMSAAGLLHVDDPYRAAEHFAFLILGADLDRGTFTGQRPTPARVEHNAEDGAAVFVRAYAVRP